MNSLVEALLQGGVSPAWAWPALLLAAMVIGVAKSGFGGGIGILAVPLVANVLAADHAVGVMLPVLIAADVVAVRQHRQHRSPFHLRWSLLGGTVGILAGTALLLWFMLGRPAPSGSGTTGLTTLLQVAVGGVSLLMVAIQLYRMLGGRVPTLPDTKSSAVTAGTAAGFVSTLAHAAGPIMTLYLLETKLPKARLVGTLVVFFFLLNLAKLPTYLALHLINPPTLIVSAVMIAVVPLGSLAGHWMHHRIRERPFALIMYAGAALAGGRMLYLAFAG